MGIKPSPGVTEKLRGKACLTQDKKSRELLDPPVPKGIVRFHSQYTIYLRSFLTSPHWWGAGGESPVIFI